MAVLLSPLISVSSMFPIPPGVQHCETLARSRVSPALRQLPVKHQNSQQGLDGRLKNHLNDHTFLTGVPS